MKFLSIYKTMERNGPPSQEELTGMGKLVEEGMKAGWLLGTEGCLPSRFGARVGLFNGKISVTDGPFAETKEVAGGFAILKADSKEEAIQLAKNFLQVVGAGECEIRQLFQGKGTCTEQAAHASHFRLEEKNWSQPRCVLGREAGRLETDAHELGGCKLC